MIARHHGALPIRRLFEPRQGKSHACNLAVAAARGELMIWTDDDVLVDADWIAAYTEAAARWPDAHYFGGVIDPWFECTPPAWIVANLQHLVGMLVMRDFGPDEHYLARDEVPFGANMAFRTEILRENGFNPDLGPTGNDNVRGEESAMIRALSSRGIRGVWVPGARVQHFITRHRLTQRYLWEHFRGYGRAEMRTELMNQVPQVGKTCGGVPRWMIRNAVETWMLAQWKRLWTRSEWVPTYIQAAIGMGNIQELRLRSRSGR